MKKDNLKKNKEQKEEIRLTAVKLVRKGWLKKTEVSEILDISYPALLNWCSIYKKKGKKWLKSNYKKWWRPKQKDNNLTNKEKEIFEKILLQEPRNAYKVSKKLKKYPLDFWLRTLKLMQEVIKKAFWKNLKKWKVREIAKEMWFTNQQPIYKAYQQNPEAVAKREKETLPNIKEEANKEWRKIYYWDEAWFLSSNNKWKTRGKKWETPVVTTTWARFWVNAISIINSKWEMQFMTYEKNFNSDLFIEFLKKIYDPKQKKTLILDGHPSHKTKKVREYLKSIDERIKIYYLPWYSPELNPDEQVWNQVHNDLKGQVVRGKWHLMKKVKKSLYSLQKQRDKVKSFFSHPEVRRN